MFDFVKFLTLTILGGVLLLGTLAAQDYRPPGEYARVEVRGTFKTTVARMGTKSVAGYSVESEGRSWRLDVTGATPADGKVLLFVARQMDGKIVTVTGWLRGAAGEKDYLAVTRIEPPDDVPAEDGTPTPPAPPKANTTKIDPDK
jgi:hypothetical protein